ncbi:MAG TPA: carbohydrate-binding family V/XII [Thermoanaerobaculia bacterium]|nr:carbohydrate-binding family V/XII [Thermoanaerobaculia bacterium]
MLRRIGPIVMCLFAAASLAIALRLQEAAPASEPAATADADVDENGDPVWPRVIEDNGRIFSIYQPQIDKFDDTVLEARAAVQVETPVDDKTQTSYGVIWITAHTFIDKENALVQLDDIQVTKANFPTAGDKVDEYLDVLRRNAEKGRTVSLDRIEANLAMTESEARGNAVPLKNDPPRIYYRSSPAILVLIDGEPVLRPVEGSSLQRVINTKSLIIQDSGKFFMPIGDTWLGAPAATGPWSLAASAPAAAQSLRDSLAKEENSPVDLLEEPGDDVSALLSAGKAPEIVVSTSPAELILTEGKPQMKPISGTQLLYVSNTSGDIFLDLTSQLYYVALAGRWYRSKSLDSGPWEFVAGNDLPKDFARIPEKDPKAGVLATVPGTPAAKEAAIANSIPQTAEVNRDEAKFESQYDGDPRFDAVPDTSLQYAVNSATPIVRVTPTSYYAVQGGVWFTGGSPVGPWLVATAIPPVIYTIPTACPIHYVTYVRVYRYNPTYVWVGYTPGYLGTCYSPWGTVVYGTGWYYRPWIGTYWYGSPWTWGFGAGVSWSPWTGWNVGFGWGGYRPIYRPWWGPYRGWHRPPGWHPRPMPYGARPRPMPINNINVYNRPGIARPGIRPASRPSIQPAPGTRPGVRPAPGQRPSIQPVRPAPQPGTRPAPSQPGTRPAPGQPSIQPVQPGQPGARPAPTRPTRDIYAGKDGNVYRPRPSGGWETNDRGSWKPVQPARPEARPAPSQPARPEARPAPSRPSVSRPTVDSGTLNQLSRDRAGRQSGNVRMSPPPSSAPRSAAPRAPAQKPR